VTNQPTNQPNNQAINERTNQHANQTTNERTNERAPHPQTNQAINQSTKQPASLATNNLSNQQINKPTDRLTDRPANSWSRDFEKLIVVHQLSRNALLEPLVFTRAHHIPVLSEINPFHALPFRSFNL